MSSALRHVALLAVPAFALVAPSVGAQQPSPCSTARELETRFSSALEAAVRRSGVDPQLETGAAGDFLVKELTQAVCAQDAASEWLVTACHPIDGAGAFVELRRRLVRDLARMPGSLLAKYGHGIPAARRDEVVLVAAVLDTLLVSGEPADLGRRMEAYVTMGVTLGSRNLCGVAAAPPPLLERRALDFYASHGELQAPLDATARSMIAQHVPAGTTPIVTAGRLVVMLAEQDLSQPDVRYVEQIEQQLSKEGRATNGGKLSPGQQRTAAALVRSIREAKRTLAGRVANQPMATAAATVLAMELVNIVQRSLSVVSDREAPFAPWLTAFLEALLRGDLLEALSILERDPGPLAFEVPVPRSALEAMRLATRLGSATHEDEARRILLGVLLPVGPWAEKVLFDVNAGLPILEGGETKVAGDLLLGWNDRTWGVAGRGIALYYDLSNGDVRQNTVKLGGSVDGWGVIGADSDVKFDGRLNAEYLLYDSDLIDVSAGSSTPFTEETSVMLRGSLLLGLRAQPGERFAAGLWAGAGAQYEIYDPLRVVGSTVDLKTEERFSVLVQGRVRLQYVVAPSYLTTRLRVDGSRYTITRDAVEIQVGGGGVTSTATAVKSEQIELSSRLFLDAEVARFLGFVPGLAGGLDYFSLTADQAPSVTTIVPVFGAGIRREAF